MEGTGMGMSKSMNRSISSNNGKPSCPGLCYNSWVAVAVYLMDEKKEVFGYG